MKYSLFVLLISITATTMAQQTTVKTAWLEKWDNSKNYLIGIAEAMPEEHYDFKPTERQMTFKEQLEHIQSNIDWLSSEYFDKKETEISIIKNEKERTIANIKIAFEEAAQYVEDTDEEGFSEVVEFFAGPKSKIQILNLLQDHVSHHRGQLIVYLNLKEIEPPKFVGW